MSTSSRIVIFVLASLGGCTFAIAATKASAPVPIAVTLGNDTVQARFMWLDYGIIAKDTVKTITLGITNVTARTLQVGAFSSSDSLRLRWLDKESQPIAASTCELLPGERRTILVDSFFPDFPDSEAQPKVISLMSSGIALAEIVGKEIISPSERISKSFSQITQGKHPYWLSGVGEWWSGWYVLSLGPSPAGYKLDPSSARAIVSTGQNDHPRSCDYYSHCEWVQLDEKDVSARFSVMGHHRGDWTGDTNIAVLFKADVYAEYTLIESIKLSKADLSVLEAKSVPTTLAPERIAANSLGSLGASSYESVFGLGIDKGYMRPQPPDLAVLQPALYTTCNRTNANDGATLGAQDIVGEDSDFNSCVQLGIWTYRVNGLSGYDQAVSLFTKACNGKLATGCTHLGDLLVSNGFPASGIPQLELGCALKDGLACYILGEMSERGLNTVANPSAAKNYFERACKNRFPAPGCSKTKVSKRLEF